jgi:hypothetical protein
MSSKFTPSGTYKWKKLYLETEPAHKRAQREVDVAEWEYKKSIAALEKLRISLESQTVEFMTEFELALKAKIGLFKTTLDKMTDLERLDYACKEVLTSTIKTFLESLDPEKELQVIMEQEKTGSRRMPPFIYRHVTLGPTETVRY